jgi:hypothetical protein
MNDNEEYRVSDFQLAVALLTLGCELFDIDRTNIRRQVFLFYSSPELERASRDFFQDKLLLNPRAVMSNARFLKERLRG